MGVYSQVKDRFPGSSEELLFDLLSSTVRRWSLNGGSSMIKNFLFSTTTESSNFNELSMTLLRVFAGLAMAFAHGLGKFPISDQFVSGVASMGLPFPVLFAWLAALSEFVGGILLAAGLCTRLGALSITATMAMAAFVVHAQDPFMKKEMALLYLVIGLVFLARGAGKFSVDRFASR